jgi:hypothetical protein
MAVLCTLEIRCYIARTAVGLHGALLFYGVKPKFEQRLPVKEDGLAFTTVTDTWKECTARNV